MQFALSIIKDKIIGGDIINNYVQSLKGKNAVYTVEISPENSLSTPRDCMNAYFFKLDLVVQATGMERYNIHEEFKTYSKIKSTKEFSVVDWRNFIKNFQEYIFKKLDIVI